MIIIIAAGLILGLIGGAIASAKGRSFFGWFLICFLTGGLGILILIFMSSADARHDELVKAVNSIASPTGGIASADLAKWRSLVELDPDIAAAAARVRVFGEQFERMLAEKYIPLNDKTYLQSAVDKVLSIAEKYKDVPKFDPPNMKNISEVFDIDGFPLYRMKDGKFALGCLDGKLRIFDTRLEAENHHSSSRKS
mgnify:CR=1 FL=1